MKANYKFNGQVVDAGQTVDLKTSGKRKYFHFRQKTNACCVRERYLAAFANS